MPQDSRDQKLKEKNEKLLGGLFLVILILFWKIFGFLTGLIASIIGSITIMVLLQKNPKHNKSISPIFGILIVVTLLVFFLPAIQSDKQHRQESEEILSGVAQNYNYKTEVGTPERNIELKLLRILGTDTEILQLNFGDGELRVEYLAKDNLTTSLTKDGILLDITNISREFSSNTEVQISRILVEPYLTLVDQYGNKSVDKVVSVTFTKNTLEKINWDNFLFQNIPTVADRYWAHPVLDS